MQIKELIELQGTIKAEGTCNSVYVSLTLLWFLGRTTSMTAAGYAVSDLTAYKVADSQFDKEELLKRT